MMGQQRDKQPVASRSKSAAKSPVARPTERGRAEMNKGRWITIFGVAAGVAASYWLSKAYSRSRASCPPFAKRSYTDVEQLTTDLRAIWVAPQDLRSLRQDARITHPLIEKIMLAISGANGCRLCSGAQARYAARQGLSSTEIDSLLRGEISYATADEAPALVFAQHFAHEGGRPDPDMVHRIEEIYGPAMAQDLMVLMRVVLLINLVGNSIDALWSRILGCPSPDSSLREEIKVVAIALFGIIPLMPVLALRAMLGGAGSQVTPA